MNVVHGSETIGAVAVDANATAASCASSFAAIKLATALDQGCMRGTYCGHCTESTLAAGSRFSWCATNVATSAARCMIADVRAGGRPEVSTSPPAPATRTVATTTIRSMASDLELEFLRRIHQIAVSLEAPPRETTIERVAALQVELTALLNDVRQARAALSPDGADFLERSTRELSSSLSVR